MVAAQARPEVVRAYRLLDTGLASASVTCASPRSMTSTVVGRSNRAVGRMVPFRRGMTEGMARHPPDGTVEHPYSALNLRLVLASFGFVTMTALTLVLLWLKLIPLAIVCGIIAMTACVDIAVIQRRRAERRRREPGTQHSLFE